MKKYLILMRSILFYLWLDRMSWILLGLGVILNLVLWLLWGKIHFSLIAVLLATGVVLLNAILSFYCSRKDAVMAPLLLGTSLVVQILFLVLIKYSLISY